MLPTKMKKLKLSEKVPEKKSYHPPKFSKYFCTPQYFQKIFVTYQKSSHIPPLPKKWESLKTVIINNLFIFLMIIIASFSPSYAEATKVSKLYLIIITENWKSI